jgi:hypothetical protein
MQEVARLGELRVALRHIENAAAYGAVCVGLSPNFDTTLAELERRGFLVESRTAFFVISWVGDVDLSPPRDEP